jgi:outer membrane immunogenic protein
MRDSRGIFSLAALLLMTGGALAQEPTQAPVVARWSGYYVGLNVGGGTLSDAGVSQCTNNRGVRDGLGCELGHGPPFPPGPSGDQLHNVGQLSGSGFVGGGQIGVNRDFLAGSVPLVMGAELDMQGSTIGAHSLSREGNGSFYAQQNLVWMSTLRARIGYAGIDKFLVYGTFGGMLGQIDEAFDRRPPGTANFEASKSSLHFGPTIGGGVEYQLSQAFSVKAEALYYNLGLDEFLTGRTPDDGFLAGKDFYTEGAIVRIGVNYHL